MEEKRNDRVKHKITMENRGDISITGVNDVLSFDEESVVADTEMGILTIKGENLHISKLNLDNGEVFVEGTADIIEYSDGTGIGKGKGSFFGKLFK